MSDAAEAEEVDVEVLYDPTQETFVEFERIDESEFAYRIVFGPERKQLPTDALRALDFLEALRKLVVEDWKSESAGLVDP